MAEKRANTDLPSPPPSKKAKGLSAEDEMECINNIRVLAADMVEKANSGHPGAPMGCAPMAHVLFGSVMNYAPSHPKFTNRDRFVLSNGHACALLYSMLHLTGYDLSLDDLKKFRQLGSKTPGHPENIVTPGVEVCTGPLGQGISNAVGLAIAENHLSAVFNRENFNIVDHYTYVICGDGCLQEGISSEACSLAGHLKLGKLIVLYDDNHITIDGDTSLSFTEDVGKRFEAYGWAVQVVEGEDVGAIKRAVEQAKGERDRPSLIKVRTVIGHGSTKEGTHGVHGAPLGAKDLAAVKERFNFNPEESFVVRPTVLSYYRQKREEGEERVAQWTSLFSLYSATFPDLAAEYTRRMEGKLPADWAASLPAYGPGGKALATRSTSEEVLNALAPSLPELIGGSADLTPSNLTFLKCSGDFQPLTPSGRYIRFGVREHAMAAICNGLAAHRGLRPYCATFLTFAGYALGAIRLSALSHYPVLYVLTHDSIGLGEDGPTHQPIETLLSLRAIPNLYTIRPADGRETAGAYCVYLQSEATPVVLSLSRQALPALEHSQAEAVERGGYVLEDLRGAGGEGKAGYPALVIIATGSEVSLAVEAAKKLFASYLQGKYGDCAWVRVVSMPCLELFDAQDKTYQLSVLPPGAPVMSVEAGGVEGWFRYAHAPVGLTSFGASAPAGDLFRVFGFTVESLVEKGREVVEYFQGEGETYPHALSLLAMPKFSTPVVHFH